MSTSFGPSGSRSAFSLDAGSTIINMLGPMYVHVTEISALDSPYTVAATDYMLLVDTAGGAVVIDTAAVSGDRRRRLEIKKRSALNTVTIQNGAGDTYDGAANIVLGAGTLGAVTITAPLTGVDWAIT